MADILHIPDRSLWAQRWTYCSHSTLKWLHCGRKLYKCLYSALSCKVILMFLVNMCYSMVSMESHDVVVSLGAMGNHPLLLAGYRAQCYHLGTGFRSVCCVVSLLFYSICILVWCFCFFSHDISVWNVWLVVFRPDSPFSLH